MAKLVWDGIGEKKFEAGVSNGVLYPASTTGGYDVGEAWNGLTNVSEAPEGGEENAQYADNIKYLALYSAETFGATIEAFTYPESFKECDGSRELTTGVIVGQQPRKSFGLAYITKIGDDVNGLEAGEKIHLIYGCKAAPSERAFETINDSPEAVTFSWEVKATPVPVTGMQPTASIVIDTTEVTPEKVTLLKDALFGKDPEGADTGSEPTLLLPQQIIDLIK